MQATRKDSPDSRSLDWLLGNVRPGQLLFQGGKNASGVNRRVPAGGNLPSFALSAGGWLAVKSQLCFHTLIPCDVP